MIPPAMSERDDKLAGWIRDDLRKHVSVSGQLIDVSVRHGVVTLRGASQATGGSSSPRRSPRATTAAAKSSTRFMCNRRVRFPTPRSRGMSARCWTRTRISPRAQWP